MSHSLNHKSENRIEGYLNILFIWWEVGWDTLPVYGMHVYPFPKICQSHAIYTVAPALRDWHGAEASSWIDHCSTESTRIVEMFVCYCYCYCYCWYNYCFDLLFRWQLLWHRRRHRRRRHHHYHQYKGQHYCRHCLPPSLLRLSICHFWCDFFCHN